MIFACGSSHLKLIYGCEVEEMMSLEVESPTTYAISQNDLPVPDWDDLVESVRLGFPTAQQELDHVFRNGLRLILARRVPASLVEEKIRQVLLAIAETIRSGAVSDPRRLPAVVREMALREANRGPVRRKAKSAAQTSTVTPEPNEICSQVLREFDSRDRETLMAFYLGEKTQAEICKDRGITQAELSELRLRAKARFAKRRQQLRAVSTTQTGTCVAKWRVRFGGEPS